MKFGENLATMYTIDASVFVRAYTMQDVASDVCDRFLTSIQEQNITIFEPTLVLLEVAGVISREYNNPMLGRISASTIMDFSHISFISLDYTLAQYGFEIAADEKLRGADATYVAVALRHSTTLVSLDQDHLLRAKRIVPAISPHEALSDLGSP